MGTRRDLLRAGGALAALVPVAGCAVKSSSPPPPHAASGGPPPQAPAHGYRRQHRYQYYPDSCVYFDLDRKVYFLLDGGTWRMSAALPAGVVLGATAAVALEMDTDTPYVEHHVHKGQYPPGQAKKDGVPHGQAKKEDDPPGKGKGRKNK